MRSVACIFVMLLATSSTAEVSKIYESRHFTFPDGRMKALVLSYDDGVAQDVRFIELLNNYGLIGTFNINSGRLGQPADWMTEFIGEPGRYVEAENLAQLYADHEIASHTVNHPHLVDLESQAISKEVTDDIARLEHLGGTRVESFAYPFGEFDDRIVEAVSTTGISNARTVESTAGFELPDDFLRWHPTAHHTRALELIDTFLALDDQRPAVFVLWGHSWEFDRNLPDNNWALAESLCEKLSGHDDVWYAGAGEFARYINAVKSLERIEGQWINPSDVSVWVRAGTGLRELAPMSSAEVGK